MASFEEISHKGKVVDVSPSTVTVEILSESACSACHAKALCAMSETESKLIEVPSSSALLCAPGDEVSVVLKASMGHKAVWLAYVIPLLVLLAVLLGLFSAGAGDLASALGGIGAVVVYYFVIYLLRNRLRNEYIFQIRKS